MWTFSLGSQLEIHREKLFFRVRHREFTFQWACGIELRLHAISLWSFFRDVIFLTRIGVFSCKLLSPFSFLTKKYVSFTFTFVLECNLLQLQRRECTRELSLKAVARIEIGGYSDSVEPVPTEEEAAEYLEQLASEEEEGQILLSRFSVEEDNRDEVEVHKNVKRERGQYPAKITTFLSRVRSRWLVKMAGHKNAKRELGQYPAILTSRQ